MDAAPTPTNCSALLADWKMEVRNWGQGTCVGCHGTVLAYGKWAVVGRTGHFRVIFPSGWEEETPTFKTELEAMLWVMQQRKPKRAKTADELCGQRPLDGTEKTHSSASSRVRVRGLHSSTTDTTAKDTMNTERESI